MYRHVTFGARMPLGRKSRETRARRTALLVGHQIGSFTTLEEDQLGRKARLFQRHAAIAVGIEMVLQMILDDGSQLGFRHVSFDADERLTRIDRATGADPIQWTASLS